MSVSAVIRSIFTSAPTVLPTTIEAVSDFTRGPSSLNVTIGELAVFHCQHLDAFRVDWRLNGTLLEASNFPQQFLLTVEVFLMAVGIYTP